MQPQHPAKSVNPFEALGLPPTWQSAPIAWTMGKLGVQTPQGPTTLFVLLLDGPNGRSGYALAPEDLRRFTDWLIEQQSGISVARIELPRNGHAPG